MKKTKIRFISQNSFKIKEAQEILETSSIEVIPKNIKINELQTTNTDLLIRDKATKAYKKIGRPLFVEHTGLYLNYINQLPGGLTQIIWDALQADKFSEIFGNTSDTSVIAKTTIGYVDGKKIHIFKGEIEGEISKKPKGSKVFQWDCIFIPKGYQETFAQLGDCKNEISMRRKALDLLAQFLLKDL